MMNSLEDISKLKNIFNDKIHSIIKYGFLKTNILVVLDNVDYAYLSRIKKYLLKLKKNRNILVVERRNIQPNLGIDFLNIKLTSVVIYGQDVFAELEFDHARIRRQIIYEANKTMIALVNEFLSKSWTFQLKRIIFSSLPRLLPLMVAHLYLKGERIPNAVPDTINKYIKHNEDAQVFLRISRDITKQEINEIFDQLCHFLDNLPGKL